MEGLHVKQIGSKYYLAYYDSIYKVFGQFKIDLMTYNLIMITYFGATKEKFDDIVYFVNKENAEVALNEFIAAVTILKLSE